MYFCMHFPIGHEWFRFQFVYLEMTILSFLIFSFPSSVLLLYLFCLISWLWQNYSVPNLIARLSFMFFLQIGRNGKCKRGIRNHFFFQVLPCIRFPFTDQVSALILDLFSFIVWNKRRGRRVWVSVSSSLLTGRKERQEERRKTRGERRKTRGEKEDERREGRRENRSKWVSE